RARRAVRGGGGEAGGKGDVASADDCRLEGLEGGGQCLQVTGTDQQSTGKQPEVQPFRRQEAERTLAAAAVVPPGSDRVVVDLEVRAFRICHPGQGGGDGVLGPIAVTSEKQHEARSSWRLAHPGCGRQRLRSHLAHQRGPYVRSSTVSKRASASIVL